MGRSTYLLVRRRHGQPMATHEGMAIVDRVGIPLTGDERVVECNGEADDGDPADGIDDGQVGAAGSTPFQVDERDGRRPLDEVARGRLAEIPGAIARIAPEEAQLQRLAVRCQGRYGASPRPRDGSGVGWSATVE